LIGADDRASQDTLRLFVAVTIPEPLRAGIAELCGKLQKGARFTGAHPSWVKPDNIHITLAFLGWQPASRVDSVQQAMTRAVSGQSPFELGFSQLHLFPNERRPRVICIGLRRATDVLADLHGRLTNACRRNGFALEDRPFKPHVTLARIKSSRGLPGLRDLVKTHRSGASGCWDVNHITLFQSILKPQGAEYHILHEALFQQASPSR
jgi:2'-5' RNA ligase